MDIGAHSVVASGRRETRDDVDVEDALAEIVVLGAFCAELIACVALGVPMSLALLVGLAMFCGYGRYRGHGTRELARMCADGVCSASGVIQSFILIGALTALWRACGTVSQIVVMVTPLVTPATAPLSVFLLCSLMSFLTGTAFGTSATMGVVSMTMASSMGANPLVCGGAVLAGAYFGDRCSPMSSSALLVRSVTGTRMSDNFKAMMRSSAVPFVGAVAIYAAAGLLLRPSGSFGSASTATALAAYFDQGIVALLPVVPVIVFPLMHIGMKRSMMASIVVAALVCVVFRGIAPMDVAAFSLLGFRAPDPLVSMLMSGGGVVSMLNVTAIVCLASSFVGLFEGTGLLDGVRNHMEEVADRITPFGAILAVTVPASMVACNQTLGIMLASQLCENVEPNKRSLALALEDSAVVISPLVPWSIACTAVMTMCGAPSACWVTAVYLWFIPLWHLLCSLRSQRTGRLVPAIACE